MRKGRAVSRLEVLGVDEDDGNGKDDDNDCTILRQQR
jgi:hypothetical protein